MSENRESVQPIFRPGEPGGDSLVHKQRVRWETCPFRPIYWSEEIQTWMVFDRRLVASIFTSENFRVGLSVETVAAIEARFHLNLASLRRATAAMPVAHEGEIHATIRRQMATRLRNHSEEALAAFAATFAASFEEPARNRRIFDFNQIVLAPATARLMSMICGIELASVGDGLAPSQMLDRLLSLQRRKTINSRIHELFDQADPCEVDADGQADGHADLMVAMAILGFDTLQATLSECVLAVLRRHDGIRLDQMDWPDEIEETGAAFVERTALVSSVIDGYEIKKGQNVRLFLDDIGPDGIRSADLFFGRGRHACIGRVISQRAWGLIVAHMRTQNCGLTVERSFYRAPDFMFRFPSSIITRAYDVDH